MSDINLLKSALKNENKDMLYKEFLNKGNVLAEEQKLINREKKVFSQLLREIEKVRSTVSFDEYVKLINEYYSVSRILTERENDYFDLYKQKREEEENRALNSFSLEERKLLHKYILATYKTIDRLSGITYEVISDKRPAEYLSSDVQSFNHYGRRPIIYVPSHIGKNDIQAISEAIKMHYYLLSGDFEHIQGGINAPFLAVNGRYYFNEWLKNERQQIPQQMIDHLKSGGDLMWFIEGTWNMTENKMLLPAYWSIVDVAKEANAIIIPIGIDQYDYRLFNKLSLKTGNHFKINIGEPFDMKLYGSSSAEKTAAINALSDTLAALKYEIWMTEPLQHRSQIDLKYWEDFKSKRYKEWPYFSDEYIAELTYKPKMTLEDGSRIIISKPDEVFGSLKNINKFAEISDVNEIRKNIEEHRKLLSLRKK